MKNLKNKLTSKKGQGMIEYVIIMALLVVAAIAVLSKLGGTMNNKFDDVTTALDGTSGGGAEAE